MTRAYNTATTQQNSGGAVAGVTAGKNPVLNSSFNVWQRGTSVAFGAYTYTADRWQAYNNASVGTASQQATGDTTNLPNIQYCARVQRTSGSSATNAIQFSQSFETINSIPFAGKTVTLSFYARKGANYSPTSDYLNTTLYYGTGTDQRVLAGYTGGTAAINQNPVLTTTWQRFTYTGTIASTATEIGITFNFNPTGTAGANDYFEVTGVQLEVGSVATPYAPYSATYQGELAACHRYYHKSFKYATAPANNASSVEGAVTVGRQATSGNIEPQIYIIWKVQMRTAPSVTLYNVYSGTSGQWSDGTTVSANARAFNLSDTAGNIDNTDVAINYANAVIHYEASAEL